MPMSGGKDVGKNVTEFRKGARYAKILRKHGKKKADQVATAAALRATKGPPPTSAGV